MNYMDFLKTSEDDVSIKRSGNKKLLKKISMLKRIDPDASIDMDVTEIGDKYRIEATLTIGDSHQRLVVVEKNPANILNAELDLIYSCLTLAGIGIPYEIEKNDLSPKELVEGLPETSLQHIVMDYITKKGKNFKKVFENYEVTDPCMLTPALCKLYLIREIEKGEKIDGVNA